MDTIDFKDGNGPVPAHRHTNPDGSSGGWVADTAYVAHTAYVGPQALVSGYSKVINNGVVDGYGKVFCDALVSDNGRVVDNGVVDGYGRVTLDGLVSGHGSVVDQGIVTDRGSVTGYGRVNCDGVVAGNSIVAGHAVVTGDGVVEGDIVVFGTVVSGDYITVGDDGRGVFVASHDMSTFVREACSGVQPQAVQEPDSAVVGRLKYEGRKGSKIERFDLIPVRPLTALARHYGIGAKKYDDRNWELGVPWSLNYAAMQRHLHLFWSGTDIDVDPQTGERNHHLVAVAWHAFALLEYSLTHPELDDRVKQEGSLI